MQVRILFIVVLCWAASRQSVQGQELPPTQYALSVPKTDSALRVDGVLSETVWRRAAAGTNFMLNYPNDTARALNQTEIRLTYDDDYLYVAAVCYDKMDKPFVASSLRRDFAWDLNDNISVYLDPFGDGTNGFMFGITPLGVEREGLIANGERVAPEWDNKWYSAVEVYSDRWVAEMAIPFKSLRYAGQAQRWKMNVARHDLKHNQRSSWVPVPIAYSVSSLAFTGNVDFEQPLPYPGVNISFIPYVTGRVDRNYAENIATAVKANAGFDAKVAVTPSLNLDLTVNPDFSQVEVDQQVTSLDRFEIFFPERRQFFLENSDLFSSFGFGRVRPFFSRRIGIGRDTLTGEIVQNPILYGARLSGKVNKDWRVGLLNTQTARDKEAGIQSQNYTVAAVQRQVFGRSNISALLVNRQQSGGEGTQRYTRLAGLDYNLQTEDNKWQGKFFFHKAFQPGDSSGNHAFGTNLEYQTRNVSVEWLQEYVGANYQVNDIGYVARQGHWRLNPSAVLSFFPKTSKTLVSHGPGAELNVYTDLTGRITDQELDVFYIFTFLNTSQLILGGYDFYTYLFSPFDPTNSDGVALPEGTDYRARGIWGEFQSDTRRRLSGFIGGFGGQYFNGQIVSISPQVSYRFQPYGSVAVTAEYNRVRLPDPYNSATFWLVGPRVDVTFSRKLFLTTFMQYNQQADNVNLNARLQWRFRPVSDVFLVYSDNYFPEDFRKKNRVLVVKFSYWLNI